MAGVRRMMPALLMRMSMEPSSRTVRSTSEAQAWASATSASAGTAFEPEARTAAQTSSMPSGVGPCTTTLAPAWARPMAMPAPRPAREPVTRAFLPLRLKDSRIMVFLLSAGFQTRTAGVETRLHVHHAELAVFLFLMRRHGPQEADAMAGNGNVGVIPRGHQDGVAIAHHRDQLGILRVVVDELDGESRVGHVEVDVHFLQHGGVLVGRPTGPVAGFGNGETEHQASGVNVS